MNTSDTMSSSKAISLWILTLWILFAVISASPVNPSSSDPHHQGKLDPNPDLDQAEIIDGADPRSPDADDQEPSALGDAFAHHDVEDDDDDFEGDFGIAEEMFRKLESSAIPKRVVKILKVISESDDFMAGKGNTVRSYMPTKREQCAGLGDAYVFTMRPVSAHEDPEDLKYAELHFYAKNFLVNDNRNPEEVSVSFYYVTASACQSIGVQNLKIPKNGWLITNVTSILNHVLIDSSAKITIAMYVTEGGAGREQETHQPTPNLESSEEKLVKPFVFVYTEDTSVQKGDAQSNWQRLAEQFASRESASLVPDAMTRRRRSAVFNDTYETLNNNAIPLHPVGKPHPATTQTAFSFFAEQNMKRIKSSRRRARKQRQKQRNSKNMMLEELDEKSNSQKKNLNKPRPKHMDMIETVSDSVVKTCKRHAMSVDFQAIGWDDYVIAPPSFDAFYCAGQCSFPIAKDLHPSNHAIIQSIMHVLGVKTGVPTPCCVPEKMEPLSLLYIDEDSSVSLKKYSDMQVESCGCH